MKHKGMNNSERHTCVQCWKQVQVLPHNQKHLEVHEQPWSQKGVGERTVLPAILSHKKNWSHEDSYWQKQQKTVMLPMVVE